MLLAFVGCGDSGGGGDEDAFCEDLEELSEQVADGDMASEDGLGDAAELAGDLLDVAPEDFQDAVTEVGETLQDADPDDPDDTIETIQDELGNIAEDTCDIDEDDFAIAPEEETTTTTEGEETTTTEGGDETTTTDGGDDGEPVEVNARQEIPADFEANEDLAGAQACFDGDPQACDDLFLSTDVGSVAENYGSTCGGRVEEPTTGGCTDLITAPVPVPDDVTDTANAEACFDGDMNACDAQFGAAEEGSTDQIYGGLCGGRVENTTALCVDIFGDTAFL
jgi:hypothetical protein